ncbi:hypothetical protein GCM10023238_03440 [Streptomyces heliomycini]
MGRPGEPPRGHAAAADLRELFAADPGRGSGYTLRVGDLYVDYSKHLINDETLRLLRELAAATDVSGLRDAMFRGERINTTEDRAVLHTALRAPRDAVIEADGGNVVPAVHAVLDKMADFAGRDPLRRVDRPHRQARPQRRQHRHRRLRPRPGDGVRGAARLHRPRR